MSELLKVNNLKAGYGRMKILKGINLEVRQGEIVSLIGPNGAGKSTLLKSIFNLCDVFSGRIMFKGRNITKMPTHKLIYNGISYVPQGRQVFSDLTVLENLEMGGFIIKDKSLLKKNIDDIFSRFSFLKDKQDKYAFTLSGGQQQLLAMARAMVQSPKLLLLDEPSLGLAPKAMKEIFGKILEINKAGVTVIIVEQNARQAVKVAKRTYILENGRIALEGGKALLKDKRVKGIYLGGE